jgi:immune inhibitor A
MCQPDDRDQLCMIPPHPELKKRLDSHLRQLRESEPELGPLLRAGHPDRPGLNDGLIVPGDHFPAGTPLRVVRSAALERAPLRGEMRVVVVLVEFGDRKLQAAHGADHFRDLFFSKGKLPSGSVRDYYAEASRGAVEITGEVVGPFTMPKSLAEYAGGKSGMGPAEPNARTLARHAAVAADPHVDFGRYDNDGNGFVDAFIVVHAGGGAEQTGSPGDIWSHKWVMTGGAYGADKTKVYGYLTVPEDARLGVCVHELGHLLFGWPDLYDTDGSSEGLGNWCVMAGGSWNGGGDVPAHPSAWCKAQQGWASVVNVAQDGQLSMADVKDGGSVYRLWMDGAASREYFLVENRQRKQYDRGLPGDGLLVYHVDDAIETNTDERHPKVALLQADGRGDLALGKNRGDAGDAFPGATAKTSLTSVTVPHTRSYNDVPTGVSLTQISASGAVMTAQATVRAPAKPKKQKGKHGFFFAPAAPPAERVRQLVAELAQAVGAENAGDPWRASVDQRLAAIESAVQRQVQVGAMSIVAAEGAEP